MDKASFPTVYLVRHESTVANDGPNQRLRGWRDYPLDEAGKKDLPKLASFFTNYPVSHVISADLQRHTDTSLAIARKQHATFLPTASFRPWDNTPAWGDRPLNKALYKEMQIYINNPDRPLPGGGGETFGTAAARNIDGWTKVSDYVKDNPKESAAIVMSTRGIGTTIAHTTGNKDHIAGHDIVGPGGVIQMRFNGTNWEPRILRKDLGTFKPQQ